jgi:hypothetical protein
MLREGGRAGGFSETLCLPVSNNDCNKRNLSLVNIILPQYISDSISRVIGDGALQDTCHRVKIQISYFQLLMFKQERKKERTGRDRDGLINYETIASL